ncbi:hypothetical protein KY347_01720 [Candidatus Woesearchaeota archaeon]|nr:hypothetical protein [Candidatus Woesearchaeota archaeon]
MPFGARKNIGLVLGIILFIIGFLGFSSGIKLLKFSIPLTVNVAAWLLALGGLYLIVESITEFGIRRAIALIVAFIGLVIASMPILNQLGITTFSFGSLIFYYILLTVEGIFLVVNAFGT